MTIKVIDEIKPTYELGSMTHFETRGPLPPDPLYFNPKRPVQQMAIKNTNKTETHFFFYSILSLKNCLLSAFSLQTPILLFFLPFSDQSTSNHQEHPKNTKNKNPKTHVKPRNCCFPRICRRTSHLSQKLSSANTNFQIPII